MCYPCHRTLKPAVIFLALRVQKPALIITFSTTADAMAAEQFCLAQGLPGRLIPIPPAIHASCGLAWKTEPEEQERFVRVFSAAGIRWDKMEVLSMWERLKQQGDEST